MGTSLAAAGALDFAMPGPEASVILPDHFVVDLPLVPVRPLVDLRFLSFPQLCCPTLVRRLASLPRVLM